MPIDVEELEPTTRNDYRRANGAPMVVIDGKNERFSRPSSYAKPLDDESALVNWKIDRGCIGVAHDRALQARWVAVSDDDRESKAKLREDSISAGRGAERADIGTALHAMSCRWEQEPTFNPPEPYFSSLTSYDNELKRLGLKSLMFEFHTVNVQYRCAGTADRLYEVTQPLVTPDGTVLPVGCLLVGDLKTGEKLEYSKPAYAVQLALYAEGRMYDVITDEFVDTPPINQSWAVIVHMPADEPGRCEFLWCDLEVGRLGAYLVQQIKLWRKMWRSEEYDLPPLQLDADLVRSFELGPGPCYAGVPTIVMPKSCFCGRPDDEAVTHQQDAPCFVIPASVMDGEAPAPATASASADAPPSARASVGGSISELDGYIAWVRDRVTQIGAHHPAKQALMQQWPDGLAVPKHMTNMAEVDRAIPLLNKIEADFELGFVPKPAAILGNGPSTRKKGSK